MEFWFSSIKRQQITHIGRPVIYRDNIYIFIPRTRMARAKLPAGEYTLGNFVLCSTTFITVKWMLIWAGNALQIYYVAMRPTM